MFLKREWLRKIKDKQASWAPCRYRILDRSAGRISATFCTEDAVDFAGLDNGEFWRVRLACSAGACLNADEFVRGGAIWNEHKSGWRVGVPERLRFNEKDRTGHVVFRVANTPESKKCLREIRVGLIRGLSVSYIPMATAPDAASRTIWITKWVLVEISVGCSPRDERCLFEINGRIISPDFADIGKAKIRGQLDVIGLVRRAGYPLPLAANYMKKKMHPLEVAHELVGRLASECSKLKGQAARKEC